MEYNRALFAVTSFNTLYYEMRGFCTRISTVEHSYIEQVIISIHIMLKCGKIVITDKIIVRMISDANSKMLSSSFYFFCVSNFYVVY